MGFERLVLLESVLLLTDMKRLNKCRLLNKSDTLKLLAYYSLELDITHLRTTFLEIFSQRFLCNNTRMATPDNTEG